MSILRLYLPVIVHSDQGQNPPDPIPSDSGYSSPVPRWPGRQGLEQMERAEEGRLVITEAGGASHTARSGKALPTDMRS